MNYKKNKYHAQMVRVDGILFRSGMEARRYRQLQLLERAGEIEDLTPHPRYPINIDGTKICVYEGDAQYRRTRPEPGQRALVCEDVKGVKPPVYRLKRKLFMWAYPEIEHIEITKV